jgi:hypothetical protein
MLIVIGIILFGFCLVGWKFIGRLAGVIIFIIACFLIFCKAIGLF